MGWRGWTVMAYTLKNKLTLRKGHFFVIDKYVEDVKQDEKHVPDLPEPIMRPSGLPREDLRLILCKMCQFRSKITKIRICTFHMSGKIPDSSKTSPGATLFATFGRASGQIFEKCRFWAPARLFVLVHLHPSSTWYHVGHLNMKALYFFGCCQSIS